jgi:superfamily I DNA and/or RNA helicase
VFYDVDGAEYKAGNSQSWQNDEEARLVVSLVTSLVKKHPQLLNQGNQSGGGVGVISPYKAQVKHIRHLLEKALGKVSISHLPHSTD